jgi:excisionase family DNA binding protein
MSMAVVDIRALAHALALLGPDELTPLAEALERSRNPSGREVEHPPFLTVQEAARLAGVAPKTVHNWLSDGRLVRHGVPRRPLVDRKELEDLLRPRTKQTHRIHHRVPRQGSARFVARARAA